MAGGKPGPTKKRKAANGRLSKSVMPRRRMMVKQTLKSIVKGNKVEVFLDFISKMLKVPRPVITKNTIVLPYKSKEEVSSMETDVKHNSWFVTLIPKDIQLNLDMIELNFYMRLVKGHALTFPITSSN
ncbi:unnamed protein product [Ilex paraguariensis]|uniref:Uncharacterized protein n=1 Tax=Ilex paraguariensis TaxID=185542 RepID=A0ABC8R045_9AQUA